MQDGGMKEDPVPNPGTPLLATSEACWNLILLNVVEWGSLRPALRGQPGPPNTVNISFLG